MAKMPKAEKAIFGDVLCLFLVTKAFTWLPKNGIIFNHESHF